MKLKRRFGASPSIDYPSARVFGCLSPDDVDYTFICGVCGFEFVDKEPNNPQPVCLECARKLEDE